ncbi:MAG TPA: helix-turn-helix domain-containing protein, partial [Xanthobacteraceae bacterium]|nr:helix-turn-helix domain-containing protein [Xanthobacteraceae bacterium]
RKLKLSQREFALRFGFSLGTVRNWEQGHRTPEGPARALLTIIDREPAAVERALKIG